eukprot:jgi/Chlat1/6168/Chrsp41S09033
MTMMIPMMRSSSSHACMLAAKSLTQTSTPPRELLASEKVDVNARDRWDAVPLYYACLAGHEDVARQLLEAGAVCSEYTFDGDRCHYASLNMDMRALLKAYEQRPPPMPPLAQSLRDCMNNPEAFPDFTFYVGEELMRVHRCILAAHAPYFRRAFQRKWRGKQEAHLKQSVMDYTALRNVLQFFYTERLEVGMTDAEMVTKLIKHCECPALLQALESEIAHQRYADWKCVREAEIEVNERAAPLRRRDIAARRLLILGSSLPEEARLFKRLGDLLSQCLRNSEEAGASNMERVVDDDFADLVVVVESRKFRCHRVILSARSEYFKALLARSSEFSEGHRADAAAGCQLTQVELKELSAAAFAKALEFMYTNKLQTLVPELAVEVFDAASRLLLFSMRRAASEVLIPAVDTADPAATCRWLMLADMYGVDAMREHCLNVLAENLAHATFFPERQAAISTADFIEVVRMQPPPPERTEADIGRAKEEGYETGTVMGDLREKWLELSGTIGEERDREAIRFDSAMRRVALTEEDVTPEELALEFLDDEDESEFDDQEYGFVERDRVAVNGRGEMGRDRVIATASRLLQANRD